jgi:hypothetical protein
MFGGTPKIKYILFRPTNLKFLDTLLDECDKISNWGTHPLRTTQAPA